MNNSNKGANWLISHCYGLSSKNCPQTLQELKEMRNTKAWEKTDKSLFRSVCQLKGVEPLSQHCSLPCQSQPLKCKSTHKSQPFTARFLEIGPCICTFSTHHLWSTSAWSLSFPFLLKLLSLHLKCILSASPPSSFSNIQCYAKNSPTTLAKQKPDTKKNLKPNLSLRPAHQYSSGISALDEIQTAGWIPICIRWDHQSSLTQIALSGLYSHHN